MNSFISENVQLQYAIELGATGMVDRPTPSVTTSTKLERLRALNHAWTVNGTLRLREMINIPSPFPSYDLQKGVLTLADLTDLDPTVFRSVQFHKLQSWLHNTAPERWSTEDLGMTARDFTTDPALDLIVYQEAGYEPIHFERYLNLILLAP